MRPERIEEILRLYKEESGHHDPELKPEPKPKLEPKPEPNPVPIPPVEKWGCTDPKAANFDPEATVDDGSCILPEDKHCKIEGVVKDGDTALAGAKLTCKSLGVHLVTTSNDQGYYLFDFKSDGEGQKVKVICYKEAYETSEIQFDLKESLTKSDFKLTKKPVEVILPPARSSRCAKFDDKSFDVIIRGTIGRDYTELEVMQCLGLSSEELKKAKNQYQTNPPISWDNKVPILPALNTDHWLLGISASGKSAMLASIIAHFQNRLIMEPTHTQRVGVPYKNYLRNSMLNSCMPQDTPTSVNIGNSSNAIFAFMPFNLQVLKSAGKIKPISLIEMAGEHVASLSASGANALSKLDWVKSRNEKILTLVYDVENSYPNQSQDLVNCLGLFESQGAFKKIIKIYLVATKVDMLEEYDNGRSSYEEIKEQICKRIEGTEMSLINTIKAIIENNSSKSWLGKQRKIEFEILPMSVATELVKGKFIKTKDDRFIQEYARRMEKGLLIRNPRKTR
jgi:hypothetical protein